MKKRFEIDNVEIGTTTEKTSSYLLVPTGVTTPNYKIPSTVGATSKLYIASEKIEYTCVAAGEEINTPVEINQVNP